MPTSLVIDDSYGIRVMTLNRPEARNAINQDLAYALASALDELDNDDDLHVGIIHGSGGNFSSGMDLRSFLSEGIPSVPGRGFAGIAERGSRKPLIAAVEGYAVAGGCEIALACDLIVAGHSAKFGIPEVKRGLVAAAGGLVRLPRRLPYHVAMALALTGDMLDANVAFSHGLVNEICDDGSALDCARTLGARIAANAPLAVRASKEVIRESLDWPMSDALNRQRRLTDHVFQSDDAREGAAAFTARRTPVWRSC